MRRELDFMIPRDVGPKVRVGSDNDGGYILPTAVLDTSHSLLSAGIGDNADFEWELYWDYNIRAQVWYDPEVPSYMAKDGYGFLRQLEFNIDRLKKNNDPETILKVDIEGDEYKIFTPGLRGLMFSAIVIEWHNISTWNGFQEAHEDDTSLLNDYYVCHVHGNNYRETALTFGYAIPDVLEMTYIHKRFFNGYEPQYDFGQWPTYLDRPNNPDLYDIQLTWLRNPYV